jgi:hypothetical protein
MGVEYIRLTNLYDGVSSTMRGGVLRYRMKYKGLVDTPENTRCCSTVRMRANLQSMRLPGPT